MNDTHIVFIIRSPAGRNISWYCATCYAHCAKHTDIELVSLCACEHAPVVLLYSGSTLDLLPAPVTL